MSDRKADRPSPAPGGSTSVRASESPDRYIVLIRGRCGCRLRLDQLAGTGPGVEPRRIDLDCCGLAQHLLAVQMARAYLAGVTVEIEPSPYAVDVHNRERSK